MYVAVRQDEGVRDPSEAGRITREIFVPIIREIPGFGLTMASTPETA